METKKSNKFKIALYVIGGLILFGYLFGGGVEKQAAEQLQIIENQVAADAVKQYEIAKRNGNAIDTYVAAGMVCAAYLQANDEANYAKWKKIEKQEAQAAGMPQ